MPGCKGAGCALAMHPAFAGKATASIAEQFLARDVVTDEIHERKRLAEWIQRELDGKHAKRIAEYLIGDETRMFGAIVLGVYGGSPEWAELNVSDPRNELTDEDEDRMVRTVGVLSLSGAEKLFAIDGQHRVAGIKKALENDPSLGDDEVAVIIIGHDNKTDEGRTRTRRLFIKLNQTAKKVSDRDFVALSEDNGLAVVTRMMIDESHLFKSDKPDAERLLSFSGNVAIIETNENAVTSVLGLYQIVKGLYPRKHATWPKFATVQRARPEAIKEIYDFNVEYWQTLIETVPEYKMVFKNETKKSGVFRKPNKNHLLFRPVGQLAFARATQLVMSTGKSMAEAVRELYKGITPWLSDPRWHHILWDPIAKTMLRDTALAETMLLTSAGFASRSPAAAKKLEDLRKAAAQE